MNRPGFSGGSGCAVIAAVRPARQNGHGAAWDALLAHEQQIRDWLEKDELQLTTAS